jgi:hypothetical protein
LPGNGERFLREPILNGILPSPLDREPDAPDVLLDLPLAVEMGYARVAIGAAHRGIPEVFHAGPLGGVCQGDFLLDFAVHAFLVRRLQGEDAIGGFDGPGDGRRMVEVAFDEGIEVSGKKLPCMEMLRCDTFVAC